ncbi:MAG: right-handed parallel beta-helix repeat-containing protein, partial [Dehalococcoidia bacterium]
EGVKLKRITVTGFDAGVVVLDSEDVRVEDIRALDNEMVGIAVLAAGGITLHRNTAGSSSEAAFPPLAGILVLLAGEVELRLNRTDRNFLGIGAALVYGAWVTSNTARDNCAGIAAVYSLGWVLEYNTVHDNRSACNVSLDGLLEMGSQITGLSAEVMAASAESRGFVEGATATLAAVESVGTADDAIEFSGVGILLATVSGMDIVGNSAIGNRSNLFTTGTETVPSGGIVLVEVAGENSNLFFKGNFLRRNDVDINFDSGLPDDSKATQNRCKSNPQTSPSGYCNFNTLP